MNPSSHQVKKWNSLLKTESKEEKHQNWNSTDILIAVPTNLSEKFLS